MAGKYTHVTSELGVKNILCNGLLRVFNICCIVSVAVVITAGSTKIQDSCSKTSTPYGKDAEPFLKEHENPDVPPFHLPECDEEPHVIPHGRIVPLFRIQYKLMCDEYHTLPLGSRAVWECTSAGLSARNIVEIADRNVRGSECIDKEFPETIYVERGVYIHNARQCHNGVGAYIAEFGELLYKERTFLIRGLEFFLQFAPELSECVIIIGNRSNVFQEWEARLKFRLVHKPIYKTLNDSIFNETNCWLAAAIAEIMVENMKTHTDATFDLEEQEYMFHSGPCSHRGSLVEKTYPEGFINDVPFCRSCMRGFYLDTELGSCRTCAPNEYAGESGATKCRSCPTVHTKSVSHRVDSIMDCYEWVTKKILQCYETANRDIK